MTQETIVWDSSTGHALFLRRAGDGRALFLVRRYEKRRFLTEFPLFLEQIADTLAIGPATTVYIGAGPGSFTGLKTGIAVLGGFFYARGVRTVRLLSSLDIASLRFPWTDGALHLVVRPFNQTALFLSAFTWSDGERRTVLADRAAAPEAIEALLAPYADAPAVLIADDELPAVVAERLFRLLPCMERREPSGELRDELLPTLPVRAILPLCEEPLLLQYMASPADLSGEDSAYYVSMN